MKLSIIIPTYNSSKVICRALDSIVNQTFTDYEVLVMDGASSDDTVSLVKSYNDPRIIVASEPDNGIYDAMNKGIKKSGGEWLYFLGSDDYLLNNTILKTVFNEDVIGVDILYGDVESNHLSPAHRGAWSLDNISKNRCHQGIFYRREVFRKFGGYNLKYPVLADFDFNLKWFLSKKVTNRFIPVSIAHYSEGGFSDVSHDAVFYHDFHRLVLIRGWRSLTREQIKFHLRETMAQHCFGRCVLKIWNIFR